MSETNQVLFSDLPVGTIIHDCGMRWIVTDVYNSQDDSRLCVALTSNPHGDVQPGETLSIGLGRKLRTKTEYHLW